MRKTYIFLSAPFGTTLSMPLRNLWNPRAGLLATRYWGAVAALTCVGFTWELTLMGAMSLRCGVSLLAVQEDGMRDAESLYTPWTSEVGPSRSVVLLRSAQ